MCSLHPMWTLRSQGESGGGVNVYPWKDRKRGLTLLITYPVGKGRDNPLGIFCSRAECIGEEGF